MGWPKGRPRKAVFADDVVNDEDEERYDEVPQEPYYPPSLSSIKVIRPYAYWSDDGLILFQWSQGQIVDDPAQIEDLIARKAPIEAV